MKRGDRKLADRKQHVKPVDSSLSWPLKALFDYLGRVVIQKSKEKTKLSHEDGHNNRSCVVSRRM